MLTLAEKNKMLEMLANPVQGQAQAGHRPPVFGMVRIDALVQYRDKSDEAIRAELAVYDAKKKEAIEKQLAQIEASKARMEAELAKLTPVVASVVEEVVEVVTPEEVSIPVDGILTPTEEVVAE